MRHNPILNPIYEQLEEKFKNIFDLSIKPLEFGPRELSNWYTNSFDRIIKNTTDFRNEYPVETTTFLCELIRSDYALNFMASSNRILNSSTKNWDIYEKVRFVRDSYESIYQNFAFISFTIDYSRNEIDNLRSDWYYPYKAKDKIKKGTDNWYVNQEKVTGKNYVLKTSKLFKWLTDDQKNLLKNVRNSDSHYKTTIIDGSVFILDGSNSEEITNKIDKLCDYLIACNRIILEIYTHLFIIHKFWMLPSVLLTFSDEFEYDKREVAYNLLQSAFDRIKEKKATKKSKNGKLGDKPMDVIIVFGGILYSIIFGIWNTFENNKEIINRLLVSIDKEISISKMRDLQKESVIEILNFFRLASAKIEQFINKDEKVEYLEIESGDYDNIDYWLEIENYTNSLKKAIEAKDHGSLIVFIILPAITSFIVPISKLVEEYKQIFISLDGSGNNQF